jgi:hypothetical protein
LGYYFIDQQFARIALVTNTQQNNFNLSIEMNIYKNDYLITKNNFETFRIVNERYGMCFSIYVDFKLDSLKSERDNFINNPYDYKIDLFIRNNQKNQTTQSPIELKIKNFRKIKNDPEIEYGMVCTKCLIFPDDSYASSLKWWFELHRQTGYSKVQFCNNSIPNTPAYNDIFYEYLLILF